MPTPLFRQNAELRPLGIHQWSIPAWVTTLPDGRTINACPAAGACVKLCYARNGSYRFPQVLAAHQRNLRLWLDTPDDFHAAIDRELALPRFRARPDRPHLPDYPRDHLTPTVADLLDTGAPCIRIHDAGDFLSDSYLAAWHAVAARHPGVLFYTYTKEVARFRRHGPLPPNFLVCYSLGGREDHLLDLDVDRHADVFPDDDAITAAGYESQDPHDLLCVVSVNHRVGIPANNIAHYRKQQGDATFGQLEAAKTRHHRGRE